MGTKQTGRETFAIERRSPHGDEAGQITFSCLGFQRHHEAEGPCRTQPDG